MEIDIKNIKAAYETATESEKTLLSTLFPDLPLGQTEEKPVMERIKTFEDAVHALGEHPLVTEWRIDDNLSPDLEAYLKLRIICAALNEGWEPKFNKDEYCYSPWFRIYDKVGLDEDGKIKSRVVNQVSYADSYSDSALVDMNFGSRLVLKTKELAEYCGKQFIDIWADYLLLPKNITIK